MINYTSVDHSHDFCIQEGFRYNALHVIASKNKPEIGRMLLSTLENPALVQKMYPEDTPQIRADRIHFLLDLYLNTPDKGVCILTLSGWGPTFKPAISDFASRQL